MWAIGVYELGLTPQQFWDLTPAQFGALVKLRDVETKHADYRAGIIASNIVRVFGGNKAEKYTPDYFFPSLKDKKERKAEEFRNSPKGIVQYLKAIWGGSNEG